MIDLKPLNQKRIFSFNSWNSCHWVLLRSWSPITDRTTSPAYMTIWFVVTRKGCEPGRPRFYPTVTFPNYAASRTLWCLLARSSHAKWQSWQDSALRLLWGLRDLVHRRHSEQHLAHNKCNASVRCCHIILLKMPTTTKQKYPVLYKGLFHQRD